MMKENNYQLFKTVGFEEPKLFIGIPVLEQVQLNGQTVYILEKQFKEVTEERNSHYIVLAAWEKPWGMEFVRWHYNETKKDFYWGNYFGSNYSGAMEDYKETIAKL